LSPAGCVLETIRSFGIILFIPKFKTSDIY